MNREMNEVAKEIDQYNDIAFEATEMVVQLSSELLELFKQYEGSDILSVAHRLYWLSDIPVDLLAEAMGCSAGDVWRRVGPYANGFMECGHPRQYTSRSALKSNSPMMCACMKEKERERYENMRKQFDSDHVEREEKRMIRLTHLRSLPYNEYLQTEHWQGVRSTMLQNAGYKCQLCGDKGILNVHHNTYENLGEERANDLVVLCRGCHAKYHGKDE